MRISIFGMGYVGCILAAGYSHFGFDVIGVDVEEKKVSYINSGKPPVIEKGLDEYFTKGVLSKKITATTDSRKAVLDSEISFVAVGTPSSAQGEIDLRYTIRVCEDIANGLKGKKSYHLIVFKSTLFPGTVEGKLIPLLEKISGKKSGKDFGICHNPEFLREGEGVSDFFNPPLTIIGELDDKSGSILYDLYKQSEKLGMKEAPIVRTKIRIGEMIKYVNNSFHALKVAFANEIGNIAKANGIDAHEIMRYFCMEKDLNISPAYLKPGAPYGGSCLTKDISALRFEAKKLGIKTALLDSISESNENNITYCTELIEKQGRKNICILGLSFKEGTDDLRSSPIAIICKTLNDKGYNINIYDPNFVGSEKFGVNKALLEGEFGFIKKCQKSSLKEALDNSEIIVIKNKDNEYKKIKALIKPDTIVIDLVRLFEKDELNAKYIGLFW